MLITFLINFVFYNDINCLVLNWKSRNVFSELYINIKYYNKK